MENPDLITGEWLLVKPMKGPFIIIGLYLWFVLVAGPHLMKHRKPFKLRNIVVFYNVFQVISNFILMNAALKIFLTHDLKCQPTDFSTSPVAMRTRVISWYFYALKYVDLLDTVFFVLRKKSSQVTFLHVFHHVLSPLFIGICLKYQPGGHAFIACVLNTAVHAVMYTYYAIAALGPKYRKYLWWKRHTTEMQLVQFVIMFFHFGQLYFRECDYPRWMVHGNMGISVLFLYLFGNFYYKTYIVKPIKC